MKKVSNERNQQLPAAKRAQGKKKEKYFLILGGYYKPLAVIKTNSELHNVDNRIRGCFAARHGVNYAARQSLLTSASFFPLISQKDILKQPLALFHKLPLDKIREGK